MSAMPRSRLLLAALLLASGPADAGDYLLGEVLEKARLRAAEKLESPACRLVLTDFRDGSGRTLEENLADTGLSPAEYLLGLGFRSGRNEDTCRRGHIDAFTHMNASTVWVCAGGSLDVTSPRVPLGPNTLIHEMLHTLGLGENPPTTFEITERVNARCGR